MTKLINEKTKEIVVFGDGIVDLSKIGCKNVAEMIEAGWKDYEEPEGIKSVEAHYYGDENKVIIEYGSEKEARNAFEKACAWKRLKEKGFKFSRWYYTPDGERENDTIPLKIKAEANSKNSIDDLGLLFGGEE